MNFTPIPTLNMNCYKFNFQTFDAPHYFPKSHAYDERAHARCEANQLVDLFFLHVNSNKNPFVPFKLTTNWTRVIQTHFCTSSSSSYSFCFCLVYISIMVAMQGTAKKSLRWKMIQHIIGLMNTVVCVCALFPCPHFSH